MNLLNRRRLMFSLLGGGGRLPAEYQETQYTQSNADAFIRTAIPASLDVDVDLRFAVYNTAVRNDQKIMGVSFYYGLGLLGDDFRLIGSTWQRIDETTIRDNEIHTYRTDGIVSYCDDLEVANNYRVGTSQTITLFAVSAQTGTGTDQTAGYVKIYSAKFYQAGVLIADFIPCKRKSDNVAGMYDAVSQVFYTSANSASFIAGPIVSEIPVGVGIKTSAGYLLTADYHALADKPSAVGVYVYDGTHLVIVHPTARSRQQYSPRTLIPNMVDASSHNIAITDFAGEENTLATIQAKNDGVISFAYLAEWARGIQFSDGNKGHIPSAGELWLIRQNINDVNDALTEIGGTTLSASNVQYVSSTQYGEQRIWRTIFNGGAMTNDTKNSYFNAFAVTNKR